MKLAIIHLSDIHLKSGTANSLLPRQEKLRDAIRQASVGHDACFVVFAGDAAYGGKESDYALAAPFFVALLNGIASDLSPMPVTFVIIPGNHDCNFLKETGTRKIIIQNLLTSTIDDTEPLVTSMVVQQEYATFAKSLAAQCPKVTCHALTDWFASHTVSVGSLAIEFQLYNSAWASQLHEKQGNLYLPVQLLPKSGTRQSASDIVVGVIHHPFNWFESSNARELRAHLEAQSDLILTGHEHVPGFFEKNSFPGPNNSYVEGGVLQESSTPDESAFNAIRINTTENTQTSDVFIWSTDQGLYARHEGFAHTRPFCQNQHRLRGTLPFTVDFDQWLSQPGVHLSHPEKKSLSLDDIFVHPDFREVSHGEAQDRSFLHGHDFIDIICRHKSVLIIGAETSGKTTLAKKTIRHLRGRGLTPLYLGSELHLRTTAKPIADIVHTAVTRQYGKDRADAVHQLPREQRALILDDYQHLPLDQRQRRQLLQDLSLLFETIILLATDDVRFEEFAKESIDDISLWEFKHLELLEFGFVKRNELIHKWFGDSLQSHGGAAAVQATITRIESQLTRFIGEQVIPPYPLFLLIVLQQLDLKSEKFVTGSVGYLYHALILRQLDISTNKYAEIDTQRTYLSELAWHLFTRNQSSLERAEVSLWHGSHCARFKLDIDCDVQFDSLCKAELLAENYGNVAFKYPYVFYYFVAQYMADHITTDNNVRLQVQILTTYLHQMEAANIILFLCHASKDPFIIRSVAETAKRLFASHPICLLDEDVKSLPFASEPRDPAQEVRELGPHSPHENRRALMADADAQYVVAGNGTEGMAAEVCAQLYDRECDFVGLNEQLQLGSALKTIQIIGQILRNHYGSIEGGLKAEMVVISTELGLRAMHCLLGAFRENLEGMVNMLVESLQRKQGSLPPLRRKPVLKSKVRESVNESLWGIARLGAFSIVKNMSESLGSQRLAITFHEVFQGDLSPALGTVDLAIRLDHYDGFPTRETLALVKKLAGNPFALSVVRDLVFMRFYLYETDYKTRQRICEKLQISETSKKKLLHGERQKKGGPPPEQRRLRGS